MGPGPTTRQFGHVASLVSDETFFDLALFFFLSGVLSLRLALPFCTHLFDALSTHLGPGSEISSSADPRWHVQPAV